MLLENIGITVFRVYMPLFSVFIEVYLFILLQLKYTYCSAPQTKYVCNRNFTKVLAV